MEGGKVIFLGSDRGTVFLASSRGGGFRRRKLQTSVPQTINSEIMGCLQCEGVRKPL